MKILKRFFLGMLPVLAGIATAATFNLFSPATGILKGNASTYVTTAAVSSDIIATFSGTCNNGTYLRGDGTCNTPPGTGVSSVGLTMPTGFSVGGSPVTSSGTLAVTTALNGVVHADGAGFSASNVNLASEVTGTLPVANGGTGAATLTGILKGNGTSAFSAAVATDVSGLFSGCTLSTQYLAGDGTCQAASSGPSGANPTASVGLSAVNGAASTFMRSDGAPALSQAIAPTWTALHKFSVGGEEIRLVENASNGFIAFYDSTQVTRRGYLESSATNSRINFYTEGSNALWLGTNATARLAIDSDGSWDLAGTTPGSSGEVLTSNGSGSAPTWQAVTASTSSQDSTGTVVGCTTDPAPTIRKRMVGKIVSVYIINFSCTSNSTAFSITGAATGAFVPTTNQGSTGVSMLDNSAGIVGFAAMNSGGTITFAATNGSSTGFTAAGSKGISNITWSYWVD